MRLCLALAFADMRIYGPHPFTPMPLFAFHCVAVHSTVEEEEGEEGRQWSGVHTFLHFAQKACLACAAPLRTFCCTALFAFSENGCMPEEKKEGKRRKTRLFCCFLCEQGRKTCPLCPVFSFLPGLQYIYLYIYHWTLTQPEQFGLFQWQVKNLVEQPRRRQTVQAWAGEPDKPGRTTWTATGQQPPNPTFPAA